MSYTPHVMTAGPSHQDFKSISSCGVCPACEQVGAQIVHVKTRLATYIQRYKVLGTAYFTNVAAVKLTWFDEDTNATITKALHSFPILEVMSSESQPDFITTLCILRSAWNRYSDVYDLTEEANDGCRASKLVWDSALDDFTQATNELLEMVKRCDDGLIDLEAAVKDITHVAKRTVPGSAAPLVDPEIYQDYHSWKALVEALEG